MACVSVSPSCRRKDYQCPIKSPVGMARADPDKTIRRAPGGICMSTASFILISTSLSSVWHTLAVNSANHFSRGRYCGEGTEPLALWNFPCWGDSRLAKACQMVIRVMEKMEWNGEGGAGAPRWQAGCCFTEHRMPHPHSGPETLALCCLTEGSGLKCEILASENAWHVPRTAAWSPRRWQSGKGEWGEEGVGDGRYNISRGLLLCGAGSD